MGRRKKQRVGRVLVTRKRGRKRFEDCDSIENSLRSVDPWSRIGWRQRKESFSLMTKPKWLPLIWPTLPCPATSLSATSSPQSSPHRSASLSLSLSLSLPLFHFSCNRHTLFIGWPRKTMTESDKEEPRKLRRREGEIGRKGKRERAGVRRSITRSNSHVEDRRGRSWSIDILWHQGQRRYTLHKHQVSALVARSYERYYRLLARSK